MLDQGEYPGGHESSGAYRRASTGDLGDLHDAATMGDLHPPAIAGGFDLVGPSGTAGVDDNLGAVTLHGLPSLSLPGEAGAGPSVLVASRRRAHRGFSRTIVRGGSFKWTRGTQPTRPGHPVQLPINPDHSRPRGCAGEGLSQRGDVDSGI